MTTKIPVVLSRQFGMHISAKLWTTEHMHRLQMSDQQQSCCL